MRTLILLAVALLARYRRRSRNCPSKPTARPQELLPSADPALAANKKLVFDFWREVLQAHHVDRAPEYLAEGYVQHNPNVATGRAAFMEFFGQFPPEPIKEHDRRPRQHRRGSATSSCSPFAASCPTSRARGRPTRRRGSTCSASPTARSSSTGTTARKNSRQRNAQYCTPCASRNASASRPRSSANVASMPACVHESPRTVTERGASTTGQPVVGSRMWL